MKMYLVQTYYGSDFYNYMALYNEAADMWLIETGFGGGAIQEVEAFTPGFAFDDHWEEILTYIGEL